MTAPPRPAPPREGTIGLSNLLQLVQSLHRRCAVPLITAWSLGCRRCSEGRGGAHSRGTQGLGGICVHIVGEKHSCSLCYLLFPWGAAAWPGAGRGAAGHGAARHPGTLALPPLQYNTTTTTTTFPQPPSPPPPTCQSSVPHTPITNPHHPQHSPTSPFTSTPTLINPRPPPPHSSGTVGGHQTATAAPPCPSTALAARYAPISVCACVHVC